jgi:glutathione synthase/RimK-type ligase-like ATP-grasp enzyme
MGDSRSSMPFTALFAEPLGPYSSESHDVMVELSKLAGRLAPTGARDTVLLITKEIDPGADAVAFELARRGLLICRLNVESIGRDSSLTVRLDESGTWRGLIEVPAGVFDTDEMRSAWLRRPFFGLLGREVPIEWHASFAWRERDAMLRSLCELLTEAFWLDSPASLHSANAKLAQLRAAASLGWTIPDTVATDDPGVARAFYEKHHGDVIVKAFRGELGASVAEDTRLIYTRRVQPEDLLQLEAIRHAPCIFQARVPKSTELRVTVIGRRIFAAEIHGVEVFDDWRKPSSTPVTYTATSLSKEAETACLALMAKWDLTFAALDLVRRPDGKLIFLEINTHAEWLWIEHATGLPMTAAIADLLEQGRPA